MFKHTENKVLALAGCGGGYDLFGALPLYFEVLNKAKKVILINLSFTDEQTVQVAVEHGLAKQVHKFCYRVDKYEPHSGISSKFFPEAHLASRLGQSVYAILVHENPTLRDLEECYAAILSPPSQDGEGPVDCFYLVDGGCDVLLRGDEEELGTPVEDMMHLKVVRGLKDVKEKFVMAVGVDVDMAHRVTAPDLDKRLQQLSSSLVHQWQWTLAQPSVVKYCEVLNSCQPINTIVQSLIVASLEGKTGYHTPEHLVPRIGENKINLGPRLCTAFIYPLDKIAGDVLYLERIRPDMDTEQVDVVISRFQGEVEAAKAKTKAMAKVKLN